MEVWGHAGQETCSGCVSTGGSCEGGIGVTARVVPGWLNREFSITVGDTFVFCLLLELRKTLHC